MWNMQQHIVKLLIRMPMAFASHSGVLSHIAWFLLGRQIMCFYLRLPEKQQETWIKLSLPLITLKVILKYPLFSFLKTNLRGRERSG